ncbi:hypothetical protein NCER_102006 [Vairimorpha ceranae BRL01]|nr:hypothetical protein NCER_102006 [Vairimorpha ceranae BRL01]
MNLDQVKKEFLEKLKTYPFETDEEALSWGITDYKLNYASKPIPLETPFCIQPKKVNKKMASTSEILENDTIFSESTEDEYSSTDEIYHDDIVMNINLSIKSKLIIDSCNLTINRSKKYGLVGRNGIGKTTF